MTSPETVLLLIAAVIFLGFFGNLLFKSKGIPETLSLIFLGVALKFTGVFPPGTLDLFVPIFSQLTLAMIMFNVGMQLDLRDVFGEGAGAIGRSSLYMFLSVLLIFTLYHLFGGSVYQSLLLGAVIGGETTAAVI
ncbi:MAG: cation:proton antiporter, partial [Nitrososphaerota archaeon]|nr:cation:proton antiporter [Nitrososphaerota archaeon]